MALPLGPFLLLALLPAASAQPATDAVWHMHDVGVKLDLDNGSLRFFKNGVQHGPGYAAGSMTGPVVAAVQMANKDERVRLLPYAEAPAGV
jgi:hypothetical protein